MDVDAELIVHILADGVAKRDDFFGSGSAEVDQDQRLFVVHASPSERLAFPSALVYHPSGRYLHPTLHFVEGHLGIVFLKRQELLATHNRVHEETARIALHLRVGQFGVADVDDGLTHLEN